MSAGDKIKAATEKVVGKAKEVAGDVTDNDKLKAEGKAEQLKGDARKSVEDVKDTLKD